MADDLTLPATEVGPYLDIIRGYEKAFAKWQTRVKNIIKRYLDERPDGQAKILKYNILWANVETLKPAIYAKTPKPEVERRFLDKDPVGRVASDVLERCLDYYIATTPFGSTMRQARNDYLLAGRGVCWARYEPKFKPASSDAELTDDAEQGDHSDDDQPAEVIEWEEVKSDYVHWKDFGHNVARTWEEVNIVWRIVYMTRQEMKKRGFADWNTIALDYQDKDLKEETNRKAAVYELWDKSTLKVYWLVKSHPKFLDEKADFLKLDRFFPCSEPVYATLANENLVPVPDYVEYQDQAAELDELTARISALQKAIKAAGVYDGSQAAIGRLLDDGVTNTLIAVDSWAALAEKGGLAGAMELLPMEEIAKTLLMLYDAREKVKQDLYEITGMSDIVRGANNPNATATSENIKNNYVTLRLSEKQREMQRFARNTIEIMGNIICRHVSDDTIKQVSGVQLLTQDEKQRVKMQAQAAGNPHPMTGQPIPKPSQDVMDLMDEPAWDEVLALLRDNPDRCFRIDIETDSTIEMDAQQDRDEAMQFLEAVGSFIKSSEGLPPSLAPLAGAMLEFGVRKWRVGRSLEGVVNKTVQMLEEQAANPPQPQPDPAMAKVQGDMQIKQAALQNDQQLEQQKLQTAQAIETIKFQGQQQLEAMRAHNDQQIQLIQSRADMQAQQQKMMIDAHMQGLKAMLDAKTKIEVAEITAGATLDAAQITAANQGTE